MDERRFFFIFPLVLLIGSIAAFAIHALVLPDFVSPVHPLMVAHGAAMYAWYGLTALQASLIVGNRFTLHRRLGYASVAVALAVLTTGWMITLYGFRVSENMLFFSGNSLMLIVFAALYCAAISLRNNAQAHKRLILFASITVYVPVTFRTAALLGDRAYFSIIYIAIILVIPIWELVRTRRLQKTTMVGAGSLIAMVVLTFILANSAAWAEFAKDFFDVGKR